MVGLAYCPDEDREHTSLVQNAAESLTPHVRIVRRLCLH